MCVCAVKEEVFWGEPERLSPPTLPCPALLFSARTTSSSSSSLCRSTHLYRISGVYYTPRAHLSGLFLPRRTFLPLKEEAHRCKPEVPASQPQESVCVCVCVCVFPILCVCSSCRPRSVPSASVQPCTRRWGSCSLRTVAAREVMRPKRTRTCSPGWTPTRTGGWMCPSWGPAWPPWASGPGREQLR